MPPAKGNQKPCELWGGGPGCEIPLGGTYSVSRVSTTCTPLGEKSHLSHGGKWWKLHIPRLAYLRSSVDISSCSWMQPVAVGLCVISQCLFRLRKTGHLMLMATWGWHPSPWPKTSLAWPTAWAALAHTLYCWPVTSATLTDWDKKYLRKSKKYFLFSLSRAHLVHARVVLCMGRSNRKSLQSKHSGNTTAQSWAWQTHCKALTKLIECLGALQAFTTAWGLDGRCIFHPTAQRTGHGPLHKQLPSCLSAGQKRQEKAWLKKKTHNFI